MSKIIDQSYLLKDQYKDATNLDARVRLHRLFSANNYGWQRWCFDQYALPAKPTCWKSVVAPRTCGRRIRSLDTRLAHHAFRFFQWHAGTSEAESGPPAAAFRFEIADAQQTAF